MWTRREFQAGVAAAGLGAFASGCATVGSTGAPVGGFSLDDLERRTFQWFWDTANPVNGLVPDRWPTKSFSSIAAVGFGLTAYPIGVERGWVSRGDARARTLTTLRFFAGLPQGPQAAGVAGHKGFFYHFLDMDTGHRFKTTELSSIDTVLFLGGALFAAQYFDGADREETEIRRLANQLNDAVDWRWMLGKGPFVSMGWKPEDGFIASQWDQYNEATLLYVLALGSRTHAISPDIWTRYTAQFDKSWGDKWGERHLFFPPHFGHQYSHVWVDFRGIRDPWLRSKGLDLFENSRRATRAQRNYAIANPKRWTGYDGEVWGLTACDGPGDFKLSIDGTEREFFSYSARGPDDRDDGTIAPTAMAASIAFEPELVRAGLAAMQRRYGPTIYGQYGFLDSFNPTLRDPAQVPTLLHGRVVAGTCWVDGDYLGIDLGPIIAMIANERDSFVWERMKRCRPIVDGLKRAGFAGGWLDRAA
ncbi:glucoamylase family protein [Sphingomonas sp. LY160]|uniref:glucoamylase family protein n=1 Tax=Sphingomonas sp. LY160 TaxID=3095342 RepID=UPI002ADEF20C|nr:glucoamylase family protein [Sphingomonas sp. LY160]MEA1072953.1 glucoamylase family protein [Sphingomonas sp. LY160]